MLEINIETKRFEQYTHQLVNGCSQLLLLSLWFISTEHIHLQQKTSISNTNVQKLLFIFPLTEFLPTSAYLILPTKPTALLLSQHVLRLLHFLLIYLKSCKLQSSAHKISQKK